jgi:hypothetical protein
MALSNISKNHLEKILKEKYNDIEIYRNKENMILQSTTYAKLDILFEQLDDIKNKIMSVANEGNQYNMLNSVICKIKKVPGNVYHLYSLNNNKLSKVDNINEHYCFSLVGPTEWDTKNRYIDSYKYNIDGSYTKI